VRLALIGAGDRGQRTYARFCRDHPDEARLVAVADPDGPRRDDIGAAHAIPHAARFDDWRALLEGSADYDGVIIATPDAEHVEPAIAAVTAGCRVLLEKPVARTEEDLRRLSDAVRESRGSLTVAHELRYAGFFETVRNAIAGGRIGEVMSVDLVENIGYWHFAHSYVRGNWSRTGIAAPMILAKSCHDLDILRWLVDSPCVAVSSMGSLRHFRPENAPPGAPERCLDGCPVAETCPYDAVAFYLGTAPRHWPASVVTPATDPAAILDALATGPYGRCVYRAGNDAIDHQVAIFEFAKGATATFTASAFTADSTRTLKVMGTHGQITGSSIANEVIVQTFVPGAADPHGRGPSQGIERITFEASDSHGGGDARMLSAFVRYLRIGASEPGTVMRTTLEASIESHRMAFAAERSRLEGSRVPLEPWA
jgi:predicted dehydrogenase